MRRHGSPLLGLVLLALLATLAHSGLAASHRTRSAPVPAPPTHGVDPYAIDGSVEIPGPAGGPNGAPLDMSSPVSAADVRRSEPSRWCGAEHATDDTTHAAQNGDAHYHLIYAVPSDGADRFGSLASQLQGEAFRASGLLETLYGRAIRFDMGTSCGPQFADISAIRLPQSRAQLAALARTPNATYAAMVEDLNQVGFPTIGQDDPVSGFSSSSVNWLLWLDGPAPAGCGQGSYYADTRRDSSNDSNAGGKLALIFRRGTDFCGSNTVRHEIGHNLGAVQATAPHYDGTGHCNDTPGDTMCISAGPVDPETFQSLYFDANDDDYWDPPGRALGWWTVDLSRFLCPSVACNLPGGANARSVVPPVVPGGGVRVRRAQSNARLVVWRARGRGRWRWRLQIAGSGQLDVTVACRRGKRVRKLYDRAVTVPRTMAGSASCDHHPRAWVKPLS